VYVYAAIVAGFCFTLLAIVKKKLHAYFMFIHSTLLLALGNFFS
jgi:hypothetical protein